MGMNIGVSAEAVELDHDVEVTDEAAIFAAIDVAESVMVMSIDATEAVETEMLSANLKEIASVIEENGCTAGVSALVGSAVESVTGVWDSENVVATVEAIVEEEKPLSDRIIEYIKNKIVQLKQFIEKLFLNADRLNAAYYKEFQRLRSGSNTRGQVANPNDPNGKQGKHWKNEDKEYEVNLNPALPANPVKVKEFQTDIKDGLIQAQLIAAAISANIAFSIAQSSDMDRFVSGRLLRDARALSGIKDTFKCRTEKAPGWVASLHAPRGAMTTYLAPIKEAQEVIDGMQAKNTVVARDSYYQPAKCMAAASAFLQFASLAILRQLRDTIRIMKNAA